MSNARKLADNLPSEGQLGNRNIIINSAMKIAQRGTSSTTTNGFGTVDRFRIFNGSVGNVTTNQHSGGTNAVDGVSNYSFRATATNTASLAAGSDAHIRYVVEDKDIENIGLTNPNNNFTLSFYVKCSNTGQSSVALTSGNFSSATYVVPFTIASADTWQRVELTFPGLAALSNVSGGFGLRIYWDLGIGTNYQTSTYNQWITSGNPFAAAGNLQIIGVYDRWLQITGVQLEAGSQSTPFEHRSFGDELQRCKRYFEVYAPATNDDGSVGVWRTRTSVNTYGGVVHFHEKRVQPTVTIDYDRMHKPGVAKDTLSTLSITISSGQTQSCTVNAEPTNDSSISTSCLLGKSSGTGSIKIDAEL